MDLMCSYQELAQVPLAEKAKVYQDNLRKGTRQTSPVSSVEGVPAIPQGNDRSQ